MEKDSIYNCNNNCRIPVYDYGKKYYLYEKNYKILLKKNKTKKIGGPTFHGIKMSVFPELFYDLSHIQSKSLEGYLWN